MIKKEKEHAFAVIDVSTLKLWKVRESSLCGSMTLIFGKLSPPIPSAEIGTKLTDVQSPQRIPGCVKLNAMDKLSKHFTSTQDEHLHIIVEAPPTRKSFSTSQTISLMLFRGPGYERCRRRGEERSDLCLA